MNTLFDWAFSAKPAVRIGFEDVLSAQRANMDPTINVGKYVIIHTMDANEPCLIAGTLSPEKEEQFINDYLTKYTATATQIILYGRHSADETPYTKYKQLLSYGISEVSIYSGGLFEWLLLQDIYGVSAFTTTVPCRDMLKYRPSEVFGKP